MSRYEQRLAELGLTLPAPMKLPAGFTPMFPWVSIRGNRVFASGHSPLEPDGSPAGPFGQVGATVSIEAARASAGKTALSILASLKRELGTLDRITGWCRVFGMVNCMPGLTETPAVINGFSEVILDVFGPEVGRHARSAVGVAALPFDFPVGVEAEVAIAD